MTISYWCPDCAVQVRVVDAGSCYCNGHRHLVCDGCGNKWHCCSGGNIHTPLNGERLPLSSPPLRFIAEQIRLRADRHGHVARDAMRDIADAMDEWTR